MGKWIHRLSNVDPSSKTADCAYCGRTRVFFKPCHQRWRCFSEKYKERRRYSSQARVQEKRKAEYQGMKSLKGDLAPWYSGIKEKGCVLCGYNKHPGAIDLHHVNRDEKKFSIGGVGTIFSRYTADEIQGEAAKCVALCANCHREFHGGVISQEVIESLPRAF